MNYSLVLLFLVIICNSKAWTVKERDPHFKCVEGFTKVAGRTPMLPRIASFGNVSTIEKCGHLCNIFRHHEAKCCSFEWSQNEMQCNLSPLYEGSADEVPGDFVLCSREITGDDLVNNTNAMKRQLPLEGRTFQFSDSYIIHDASLDSSECRVGYEHRSGSIAPAVYMHTPLQNSDDCGQLCDVFDMSLSRTCCSYEYYHSGTDAKLCKLHDQCDPTGPNSDDVYFCARAVSTTQGSTTTSQGSTTTRIDVTTAGITTDSSSQPTSQGATSTPESTTMDATTGDVTTEGTTEAATTAGGTTEEITTNAATTTAPTTTEQTSTSAASTGGSTTTAAATTTDGQTSTGTTTAAPCGCLLNTIIEEDTFVVSCAEECQKKCKESCCCQFFNYNINDKSCGLRNYAPGGRSFTLGGLSGLREESVTSWINIGNSHQVGKSLKASTCAACQSACSADDNCKTMIFNELLSECSLNYGDGPYRASQVDSKYQCFGISSAYKTCDGSQNSFNIPSMVF